MEWAFLSKKEPTYAKQKKVEEQQPVVDFVNMEQDKLNVYWVSPGNEEEVFMLELPEGPHSSKPMNTHMGHVFYVRDQAGELLQKVTATRKSRQRHEIRRKSEL